MVRPEKMGIGFVGDIKRFISEAQGNSDDETVCHDNGDGSHAPVRIILDPVNPDSYSVIAPWAWCPADYKGKLGAQCVECFYKLKFFTQRIL